MKKSLTLIGFIDTSISLGGETMKNQLIVKYLKSNKVKVNKVDIQDLKSKNIFKIMNIFFELLKTFLYPYPRKIIISTATKKAFLINTTLFH